MVGFILGMVLMDFGNGILGSFVGLMNLMNLKSSSIFSKLDLLKFKGVDYDFLFFIFGVFIFK